VLVTVSKGAIEFDGNANLIARRAGQAVWPTHSFLPRTRVCKPTEILKRTTRASIAS